MTAGAPLNNLNAEKWTFERAKQFFADAIELSRKPEYDFIGEVAYDLGSDKSTFDYLVEKFPELSRYKVEIKNNCEVNCFRNSKKGNIREATAIVNLKSNHGWTDRQQTDVLSGGEKIKQVMIINGKEIEF